MTHLCRIAEEVAKHDRPMPMDDFVWAAKRAHERPDA
jgi:hypothetical protein